MSTIAQLGSALRGRYDVEREIGAGGMATVYLARDVRHNRSVALKVLNPELGAVLGVDRFLAEIQVTAGLQHPHLLPLFESGEAGGLLFYVMPYVDGESLRARLQREKQLPVDEAVRIAVAVASALEYAHARDVIHRDLKPENILMQAGEPVIADFGIALAVSKAGGARVTQTGISLGTPQYMSPEQATGDRAIDGRTDIYSLAALTYEMLTGDPPHTASTAQAIIAKVLTERPTSVRATRAAVPAHIARAIDRGLEKLPADRWSSARDFSEAMLGRAAAPVVPAETLNVTTTRRGLLRALATLSWPAAFGLAVGAAIWGWTVARREPPGITVRAPLLLPGMRAANPDPSVGSGLAISPDGRRVVFSATVGGVTALYVREAAGLQPRMISGTTTSGGQPFFSPDGKWIGFFTGGRLQKVSVDGGAPVPLTDVDFPYGATWTTDGRIIIAAQGKLIWIPETGGRWKTFAVPDSQGYTPRWPLVLDGNKTVVCSRYTGGLSATRIGIVSGGDSTIRNTGIEGNNPIGLIDDFLVYGSTPVGATAIPFDVRRGRATGQPIQVLDSIGFGPTGALRAALSASSSLVYIIGESLRNIVIADFKGTTRTLVSQPGAYLGARYSPDGRRLALAIGGRTTDVWIYDLATGTNTRLTTEGATNDRPEWSPDGKHVLFRSDRARDGLFSIWWQPTDATGGAELLSRSLKSVVHEGTLSPDGQMLVYRTGTTGAADVWYRRLTGDTTSREVAAAPAFTEWSAQVSPNGKWIVYESDESGAHQIYVRPFPGPGPRFQVSANGGEGPRWSRDGTRIFYTRLGDVFVAGVGETPNGFGVISHDSLFRGDFLLLTGHPSYDVSPDGKGLLMIKLLPDETRAMILAHDWKHEFRARVRATTRP